MVSFRISRTYNCDVLVVGGGGAAARAALSAKNAGADVRMVVKSRWLKSGSTATAFSELLAIAAAMGHADERDAPEIHYGDTMEAGRGFIDPELVWILAVEAPDRVQDLIDLGLKFDRQPNGKLVQGLSDFATYPRTCRANGVTARHILNTLARHIRAQQVPVDEDIMIFKVLVDDNRAIGAIGIDCKSDEFVLYRTGGVVLTTGGAHHLYKHAVGTSEMTGDGYAIALDLELPLVNMEFVQIGPALIHPSVTLLSGPVWKTNPILFNASGEEFLPGVLPKDLTVADVYRHKAFPFTVSNASFYLDTSIQEQAETNPTSNGGVWCLMPAGEEKITEGKIPKTKRVLQAKGIDIHHDKFEVGLVAQCMNGGVQITGPNGETAVSGLFVAGETAGGLRGPDRPGGNSLAEGQVFGHRAGTRAADFSREMGFHSAVQPLAEKELLKLSDWYKKSEYGTDNAENEMNHLRNVMQHDCLVIRNAERLGHAWDYLTRVETDLEGGEYEVKSLADTIQLRNMVRVAKSIVLAARERKESRSCHYRTDYPNRVDERWANSIRVFYRNGELVTDKLMWPTECSLELEKRTL